jgi:hypothetical protein
LRYSKLVTYNHCTISHYIHALLSAGSANAFTLASPLRLEPQYSFQTVAKASAEHAGAVIPRTPNFQTLVPTGPSNTVHDSGSAQLPHATPIRVVSPVPPLLSPPSNIMSESAWEFDSQFEMQMRTLEHETRGLSLMAEFGISSYSADCEEY